MSAPALHARLRKATGKTDNQRLRRLHKIPAALNGLQGVLHLEMDEEPTRHALEKLSGTHELMPLSVLSADSEQEEWSGSVMLKEVQKHPYKHLLIHLDFRELNTDKPVKLRIPLQTRGEAPGIRQGGVLQFAVREVEVICLPSQIPMFVEVDVSGLDLNMILRVQALTLPEEVKLASKENFVIASIVGRAAPLLDDLDEEEEQADQQAEEDADEE
ncbi:MAG TPA: 50S ribosomal protein L25 [Deltaproteobacteria bacterium]|nr:50S ribosomal protein L25 [Deltaproteobacteria bacterium]